MMSFEPENGYKLGLAVLTLTLLEQEALSFVWAALGNKTESEMFASVDIW